MKPLFKGPVKVDNDQEITFRLKGKSYTYGMDHYGTLKIGSSTYLIQFDIQKLSRVIRFLAPIMIHNKLFQAVWVKRKGYFTENVPQKFNVDEFIPLDSIKAFSFSMSGNSWTPEYDVARKDYMQVLTE